MNPYSSPPDCTESKRLPTPSLRFALVAFGVCQAAIMFFVVLSLLVLGMFWPIYVNIFSR